MSTSVRPKPIAAIAIAAALSACGSAPTPNPFTEVPTVVSDQDAVWSPDELLRGEIVERAANDLTAMSVIRRLRPAWLRARGANSFTDPDAMYPVVYIDEIRHGALSTLHQIPTSEILKIEFFASADATTRWGTGHPSGVINVVTGR